MKHFCKKNDSSCHNRLANHWSRDTLEEETSTTSSSLEQSLKTQPCLPSILLSQNVITYEGKYLLNCNSYLLCPSSILAVMCKCNIFWLIIITNVNIGQTWRIMLQDIYIKQIKVVNTYNFEKKCKRYSSPESGKKQPLYITLWWMIFADLRHVNNWRKQMNIVKLKIIPLVVSIVD